MGCILGRDHGVGSPSQTGPQQTGDVLSEAFEAALRGDGAALGALVSILKTRYGQEIFKLLRQHRGTAHTATMEDIFQQSIVEFMEQIKSGALAELPESERSDVVRYFKTLCDRKLEDLRKQRKDPLFKRQKQQLHDGLTKDRRLPGGGPENNPHRDLLRREIAALDPFDRLVIDRYLDEVPYCEISKETGKKISTLEALVTRIKEKLEDRILMQSPTARLSRERQKGPGPEKSCLPDAKEIRAAIEDLPIEAQNAIEFVHLKGGTIDALARSLGEQDLKIARAQLEAGYEALSVALGIPFPDSFELLNK